MGISTYMSYTGAQIFEAVGLADRSWTNISPARLHDRGHRYFPGAEEAIRIHKAAFDEDDPVLKSMLEAGGEYAWRVRGEEHMWTPDAIAKLQQVGAAELPAGLQGIRRHHQRPVEATHEPSAGCFEFRFGDVKPIRSKKSRPPPRSSSVSRPARCRTARFRSKRTPRLPWR